MDELLIPVCSSVEILDSGKGRRFPVSVHGSDASGFVVRYAGVVYGYLNRCAHVPIALDWEEGQFFESSGLYLMCATHGAVYAPTTGKCEGGPVPVLVCARFRYVSRMARFIGHLTIM